MKTKNLYAVLPDMPSDPDKLSMQNTTIDAASIAVLMKLNILIGAGWGIHNFLSGGYGSLVFLVLALALFLVYSLIRHKQNKIQVAITNAGQLSKRLNNLLTESEDIALYLLPHYEESMRKSLKLAKIDFTDNAISPFWDRIEEVGRIISGFNESVDKLLQNSVIYEDLLKNKTHTFPPFPYCVTTSIAPTLMHEYNCTIRQAQKKFEFAHIWEHRKTQKILIADFATFEQAKNNFRDSIVSAIGELNHSIKSEFKELKRI